MKIAMVCESRASWSALDMVRAALEREGHDVFIAWGWRPRRGDRLTDYLLCLEDNGSPSMRASQALLATTTWAKTIEPDLAIILGDRYEALAAAVGCYVCRVPIAHIAGGDRTLGSADDAMRDAITALASLHFPLHEDAAHRLRRELSVNPKRVFMCGAPATDRIFSLPPCPLAFALIDLVPRSKNVMVAVHPDTSFLQSEEVDEVLAACEALEAELNGDVAFIVATPNADEGTSEVRIALGAFCAARPETRRLIRDLPPDEYLSVLRACDALVGNSSSGVYEAPLLGVPSVIVGERQIGRPALALDYVRDALRGPILEALRHAVIATIMPAQASADVKASDLIASVISRQTDPKSLLSRFQ